MLLSEAACKLCIQDIHFKNIIKQTDEMKMSYSSPLPVYTCNTLLHDSAYFLKDAGILLIHPVGQIAPII